MERSYDEFTDEELYDELDRLAEYNRQNGRGSSPEAVHVRRTYYPEMRDNVEAELRRRKLSVRRPGSDRVYGTAAHIAVKKTAA